MEFCVSEFFSEVQALPSVICLFEASNVGTGAWCEECAGMELETPKRC